MAITNQLVKKKRANKPKEKKTEALQTGVNPGALSIDKTQLAETADAINLQQTATNTPKTTKKSVAKINDGLNSDHITPKSKQKNSSHKSKGLLEPFNSPEVKVNDLDKMLLKQSAKKKAGKRLEEFESVRTESTCHDSNSNPLAGTHVLSKVSKVFGKAGRLTKTNSSKQKNSHTKQAMDLEKLNERSYSELVKGLANFHNVDWGECSHPNPRTHPIKSLSGTAFWFYVSSGYFPRAPFVKHSINELFNHTESVIRSVSIEPPLRIAKAANCLEQGPITEDEKRELQSFKHAIKRDTTCSRLIGNLATSESRKKIDYSVEDDQWLLEMRSKVVEFAANHASVDWRDSINTVQKVELADLVSILESELTETTKTNKSSLSLLKEKVRDDIQQQAFLYPRNMDLEDPLADLKVKIPEEEAYIELLEQKQLENRDNMKAVEKESVVKKRPITITNDADCQICNDGDYTDDNKIVFCSKCNVSVHQDCYGIIQIPKGDWICNLCKEFGPRGRFMRCPLCTNRAGALKASKLLATTNAFEHLNPEYHAFLKSYSNSSHHTPLQKDAHDWNHTKFHLNSKSNRNELSITHDKDEDTIAEFDKNIDQCLYYDYHDLKKTYSEDELKDEPRPTNVWVHVTCVQFLPELEFGNKNSLIEGLTKIHPDRFIHECSICMKKAAGATISCERPGCTRLFHPECARRANNVLEIRDVDLEKAAGGYIHPNRKQIFVIYCEKHTPPLKIRHVIEAKQRKEKEEILNFCRSVEKSSQLNTTELKSAVNHAKYQLDTILEKKKRAKIKEDDHFLKQVEQLKKKYPRTKYLINLQKVTSTTMNPELGMEDSFKQRDIEFYEVLGTEQLQNNPNRNLTPSDEIWKHLVYKGCTPLQKYNRYKKLMYQIKNQDKTAGKTLQQQEENPSSKYVGTTGTQRSQKQRQKVKEHQEKIQKTNPQPLKPLPNCSICNEKIIPNLFDEVTPTCSTCGKTCHADCLQKKNPSEDASNFSCDNCKFSQENRQTVEDPQLDQDKIELMNRSTAVFDSNQLDAKHFIQNMDPADVFLDINPKNVSDKRQNPFLIDLGEDEFQNKRIKTEFL